VKGNKTSLGVRFSEERAKLGLSQADAAKVCGVSREVIGRYELDVTLPKSEALIHFAANGADIQYILTGDINHDAKLRALRGPERIKAVLNRVLDVQEDLGTEFTNDQLQTLMGYVNEHCPTHDMLKSFVEAAFAVVNMNLPKKEKD
jgi:transcriptional regulator with XRE-family HTH domain